MMPDATPRQLFETLRARLRNLSEILFDKAPFARQSSFRNSGRDLVTLCRGLGSVDMALERFEENWFHLRAEDRSVLREDWERRLDRFVADAIEPCNSCHVVSLSVSCKDSALGHCTSCGVRVLSFAEELESHAARLTSRLDLFMPRALAPPAPPSSSLVDLSSIPVEADAPATTTSTPSVAPDFLMTVAAQSPEALESPEQIKIRELQNECDDLKGHITALELANLEDSESREERMKTISEVTTGLERDLNTAISGIEACAEDLDAGARRYESARVAYELLYTLKRSQEDRLLGVPETEHAREELKIQSLRARYKQAVATMRLGNYQEAEQICLEVWVQKSLFTKDVPEATARDLTKNYCDILCRNGKCDIAEDIYYPIFLPLERTTSREDLPWKFTVASGLGDIKRDQGNYVDSLAYHKKALDIIMQLAPLDVDLAAESASKCLEMQKLQEDEQPIMNSRFDRHCETIWASRRAGIESAHVLQCGHHHGLRLSSTDGRFDEAVAVLSTVWERRRALGAAHRQDAIDTAVCLAKLAFRSESLQQLEDLYRWIADNPAANQPPSEGYWHLYRLGCVQAVRQNWADAEDNLRLAANGQRQDYGSDDPDTLQYGQVLAEVLRRERRIDAARQLTLPVWESRMQLPSNVLQAVLRNCHVYGEILAESNDAGVLGMAETVLHYVWERVNTNMVSMLQAQQSPLLSAGDTYGFVLIKNQKNHDARAVLLKTMELKMAWGGGGGVNGGGQDSTVEGSNIDRTQHLLNKITDLERREELSGKSIKWEPKTPYYHPLRLKYLLEPWVVAQNQFAAAYLTGVY